MSGDYLWDGSGEPDPVVAALERRLEPLRHDAPEPQARRRAGRRRFSGPRLAAALAVAALLFVALWIGLPSPRRIGRQPDEYRVLCLAGSIDAFDGMMKSKIVRSTPLEAGKTHRLVAGTALRLGDGARARIQVADIGEAFVDGPGEIVLESTSAELHKLYLHRGTIAASISARARPRLFQVGTPAGIAVDLGCKYTMAVVADGTTELRVSLGRVGFEFGDRTVFVWTGSRCVVDPNRGPGTPVDDLADPALAAAAHDFDRATDSVERRRLLERILAAAAGQDVATVWHLVRFSEPGLRELAFERLAALSPPPPEAPADACRNGDPEALEAWRVDLMGW